MTKCTVFIVQQMRSSEKYCSQTRFRENLFNKVVSDKYRNQTKKVKKKCSVKLDEVGCRVNVQKQRMVAVLGNKKFQFTVTYGIEQFYNLTFTLNDNVTIKCISN